MVLVDDILEQLYEHLTDATNYGHYLSVRCLFHDDGHASLMIYPDWYKCLACGASGKTKSLLDKVKKHQIVPVWTDATAQHKIVRNPFTQWLQFYDLPVLLKENWQFYNNHIEFGTYLIKTRCISQDVRRKIGIGLRDNFYTFPIRKDKKIVGAVARHGEGACATRYFVPKCQDPNLLYIPDEDIIKSSSVMFITFGILDAVSIYQMGFAGASTTNGKRIDPRSLQEYRKRIIFLPDKGEYIEAVKIASQLGWRGKVIKIDYPDDCKDPNDLLRKYPDQLLDILKGQSDAQRIHN